MLKLFRDANCEFLGDCNKINKLKSADKIGKGGLYWLDYPFLYYLASTLLFRIRSFDEIQKSVLMDKRGRG
jgi:hypothetical protein